jgi:hypothetical protein
MTMTPALRSDSTNAPKWRGMVLARPADPSSPGQIEARQDDNGPR